MLPTLWFRNTWHRAPDDSKPSLREIPGPRGTRVIAATHAALGQRWLYVEGDLPLLFTENETNTQRLFGQPNATPAVKDGINDFVVHGRTDAMAAVARRHESVRARSGPHCRRRDGRLAAQVVGPGATPGCASLWRLRGRVRDAHPRSGRVLSVDHPGVGQPGCRRT